MPSQVRDDITGWMSCLNTPGNTCGWLEVNDSVICTMTLVFGGIERAASIFPNQFTGWWPVCLLGFRDGVENLVNSVLDSFNQHQDQWDSKTSHSCRMECHTHPLGQGSAVIIILLKTWWNAQIGPQRIDSWGFEQVVTPFVSRGAQNIIFKKRQTHLNWGLHYWSPTVVTSWLLWWGCVVNTRHGNEMLMQGRLLVGCNVQLRLLFNERKVRIKSSLSSVRRSEPSSIFVLNEDRLRQGSSTGKNCTVQYTRA